MKTNWQAKKIGEVIFENKKSKIKVRDAFSEGDYIFFTSGERTFFFNDFFCEGENIFIATGGKAVIKFFIGKASYSTDTYSIKGNKNFILTKFLFYFLFYNLEHIENKMFLGAAIKHLQKKDFKNIEIPLPPLPEQQRIVKILDEVFEKIELAKKNLQKNLQNSKNLFESYLNNIFNNLGDNWDKKALKDIGITQTGTTPKTDKKENYGNFIPFIKPADVNFSGTGDIRYSNIGLSEIGLKSGRKIEKESVLMVCIGATIGKVGFVDKVVSCNQQINSLTVKNNFEPKFFYYAMASKKFQDKIIFEGKGAQATLPIINKSKWESLFIDYPILKTEQKSIVAKLDGLSEQTKKLEEIYKKKLDNLDELKKSILKKAFSGEL